MAALDRFIAGYRVGGPELIVNGLSYGKCWVWFRAKDDKGYGRIWVDGASNKAYAWIYKHTHPDTVLDGKMLDHLCRNRACVNPDHLEPVTPKVNTLRGAGPTAINASRTFCTYGHEFTPENTLVKKDGNRGCRTCNVERARRWRQARAATKTRRSA